MPIEWDSDDDPDEISHFDALATWLDAVKAELRKIDVVVMTVESVQLPAALAVLVRPDGDGVKTSVSLIGWAKPEIALLVAPDDEDASFYLYLDGGERVVISCGPPQPRTMELEYGGLDPAERDGIEARLIQVAITLFDTNPDWEPGSDTAEAEVFDAYFTEHDGLDGRMSVLAAMDGPPMHRKLRELREERAVEHARVWAADAEAIAAEMLAGPDGAVLQTANKPGRVEYAYRYLRKLDEHCANRNAADHLANVIGRVARRPVLFETLAVPEPPPPPFSRA